MSECKDEDAHHAQITREVIYDLILYGRETGKKLNVRAGKILAKGFCPHILSVNGCHLYIADNEPKYNWRIGFDVQCNSLIMPDIMLYGEKRIEKPSEYKATMENIFEYMKIKETEVFIVNVHCS